MQYRSTIWTWRNAAWLPFVLLVRAPLMTPLWVLKGIGDAAEIGFEFLNDVLPGIERTRVPVADDGDPQ